MWLWSCRTLFILCIGYELIMFKVLITTTKSLILTHFTYFHLFHLGFQTTLHSECPSHPPLNFLGFPGGTVVKNQPDKARDVGSIPGWGKVPWRRKWQPTSVFLPGQSHRRRSLASHSPQGCKESDVTEQLNHQHHVCIYTYIFFFRFFSSIVYYKMLNIVPCAIQ